MEGPRSEQSEPILQREPLHGPVGTYHQPAGAMNSQLHNPVKKDLNQHGKSGVNPDGHVTTQRSNSKALLVGKENFGGNKRASCLHEMYLRGGGKRQEDEFPHWTELFGVASVSLCNQDEMARHLYRHEVESMHAFYCEGGHCTEGLYHVLVW